MENIVQQLKEYKNKLQQDLEIAYCEKFLELTGLKIGDNVMCSFTHSHGTSKQSFISSSIREGIIKRNSYGVIYVECLNKLSQSYNTSNNRTGRDRKSWWVYENKTTTSGLDSIVLQPNEYQLSLKKITNEQI